jgi:uncharacterized protein (TIGR00369 family)
MIDQTLVSHSAFDAFYGLRILRCDEHGITGTMEIRPHHLQPSRVVHGGVYASIVEALASFGTNWHVVPDGQFALGMNNSTSFLRPCGSGALHGTGAPLHRGRSSWVWDVAIRDDDDRLCATGRVTLALRALPPT